MSLRVGMLARCEDRGLGIQTWEWYRHIEPDRTLLVEMGDRARNFRQSPERYPDATRVVLGGDDRLDEATVRAWLRGLDVVYTAETFYDWRIVEWANDLGVATVCHVNPEFYVHRVRPDLTAPTRWWNPTSWRMGTLPKGARHVPVPIATDRWPDARDRIVDRVAKGDRIRFLHVVGHPAAADRNGTRLFLSAVRRTTAAFDVGLSTQSGRLPAMRWPKAVRWSTTTDSVDNYWRLYDDADVLVIPRRYGGLCLPALEAMGAGLAVVMPAVSPQVDDWPPVRTVPTTARGSIDTPAGRVPLHDVAVGALTSLLDEWAQDQPGTRAEGLRARLWAEGRSWDRLRPEIVGALRESTR